MRGSDIYHVGIVVPQLEDAMAQLSDTLGLAWGPVIDSPEISLVHPESGATSKAAPRIAFSRDEPHIELMQEIPGSVWVCNPYSNLHHIGFWGAGLHSEASRLVGTGCPIELMGLGPEEGVPTTMTYHQHPLGFRVEVIDKALSESLALMWTEG